MTESPFLGPEHLALAAQLEAFAAAEIEPRAAETGGAAETNAQARDFVQRLGDAGVLRHVVPQAYGGVSENLDVRSLCIARSTIARHSSLADVMFAMQGLGSYPITLAGNEQTRRSFLPQVATGKRIAAFALTEPNAGSDAAGIECAAKREGGEYVIDGTKRFISNAGIADFYVLFVKTDASLGRKGMSAIVVEKDRPGFLPVKQMELIAPHPIGELTFKACRVPVENLLGAEGEGYSILMRTLGTFRTTVGAAACGLAQRALDEAVAYAKGRVQFGKALSEFQGLRFMLAEMATELEAAQLLVMRAAWKLDARNASDSAGSTDPSVTLASSMAKLHATETAQQVIDRALQIHGGLGVLKGTTVERLYREIRALRVYEGTSEIQKEIICHQLLKG